MTRKRYNLSPSDAAEYLGVHVDTLKRWADDGKLGHWLTPTGHRKFAVEDLQALLPDPTPDAA